MKDFVRFLCAGLFFCAEIFAQEAPSREEVFSHPLTGQNLPRFTAVCEELSRHPFVKGKFIQEKTLVKINRSFVSSGNFIIAARLGVVWETLKPFPLVMTAGPDYIIQSAGDGKKTKMSAAGNEIFMRFSETLRAVFTGDSVTLRENFQNYFMDSGGLWTLGLIPSDTAVRNFASRIIMRGDSVIRTITLEEADGNLLRYELSSHTFPAELDAHEKAFFVFQ